MSIGKLWTNIVTNPVWMMWLNIIVAIAWLLFSIPVLLTGLKNSVPLIIFISIYANVVGHLSTAQAVHVEVVAARKDVPGDVVEKIVAETEISRESGR